MTKDRLTSRLEVCIHLRTLLSSVERSEDTLAINQTLKKWIRRSQELYLQHDVLLKPVSYAAMELPEFKVLDSGVNGPSAEQKELVNALRKQEALPKNHLLA